MKLAIVEWYDACGNGSWGSKDQLLESQLLHVWSVGWIVRKTAELVQLTPGLGGNSHCLGELLIPMGMIRKIRYLGKKYDRQEQNRGTK